MKKDDVNVLDCWVTIEQHPKYQVNRMGQIRNKKTGHILNAHWKYRRYINVLQRR